MSEKLVEGDDFYYNEDGLMVLTKAHHLKRGYCCESGCKHCPYGFLKEKTDAKVDSNTGSTD